MTACAEAHPAMALSRFKAPERWLAMAVGLATGLIFVGTVRAAVTGGTLPPSSVVAVPASPVPAPAAKTMAASPARAIDAREVIVPVPGAERMRIDNPLGNVTVRAWDRQDAIHIVAEKSSASAEALARLRVHFTAWAGGEVSVETRVEMGGRERALPLVASRIDLVVEVPASLEIEAKTFAGDLSASGLRAGARLETTGGRIGISDVHGRVVTRQLRGGQTVVAVDGDIDLDGVEGQMRLERLAGARVEARVVDGDIHAEDIRSKVVRLSATTGGVVLFGFLRPRAHYDLRSYSGEVRLTLLGTGGVPGGAPGAATSAATSAATTAATTAATSAATVMAVTGFELRARAPAPITSSIPLRTLWQKGDRLRALVLPGGSRAAAGRAADRPIVELSSVLGRVVLTSAPVSEDATAAGAGTRMGGSSSPF